MARFVVRLVGEDSARTVETAEEGDTITALAQRLVRDGFLLAKMKTSERVPEPQEVAILQSQVKWITSATSRDR